MVGKKRRRGEAPPATLADPERGAPAAPVADPESEAPAPSGDEPAGIKGRPKLRKKARNKLEASAGAVVESAPEGGTCASSAGVASPPADDRRGIVHFASLPAFMRPDKIRHLMEQYGEVGRVYLAAEDSTEHNRRKKSGGNRKVKYTEGWVEFADRRIAKRVALSLNSTSIGGKKRHNFYRDDLWNMRYLPKFKWHQLKEEAIFNRQVRKARLEQKISQARRENDFYLESVQKAKVRRKIEEKRSPKSVGGEIGAEGGDGVKLRGARDRPSDGPQGASRSGGGPGGAAPDISDRILRSLL